MDVSIRANSSDYITTSIASAIRSPFRELSELLCGEYGGTVDNLWIDLELVESWARTDGKPKFPFRFQHRVSGRSRFGLPAMPDMLNVGHYSVRPDFRLLLSLPPQLVVPYSLSLIYNSTSVLIERQQKLGGVNAQLIRRKFLEGCRSIGHDLQHNPP